VLNGGCMLRARTRLARPKLGGCCQFREEDARGPPRRDFIVRSMRGASPFPRIPTPTFPRLTSARVTKR